MSWPAALWPCKHQTGRRRPRPRTPSVHPRAVHVPSRNPWPIAHTGRGRGGHVDGHVPRHAMVVRCEYAGSLWLLRKKTGRGDASPVLRDRHVDTHSWTREAGGGAGGRRVGGNIGRLGCLALQLYRRDVMKQRVGARGRLWPAPLRHCVLGASTFARGRMGGGSILYHGSNSSRRWSGDTG